MLINNLELIAPLLPKDTPKVFCHMQIVCRAIIPTKQGCHLLVRPFNLKEFNNKFPDIDVHKNSMGTLLYYPSSI